MADAADTPSHTCAQCGAGLTGRKRKYCSVQCNWTAADRRKGYRPLAEVRAEEYARTHRECPECKRMFRITRHDNHSKGPQVHCSLDCRHAATKRRAIVEREASIYKLWSSGFRRGAQCTKYQRWGQRARTPCLDCGKPVGVQRTKTKPAQRCAPCAEARNAHLSKVVRKARKYRERAAAVELVDPIKVFDRDGWRCHLCGKMTLRGKRGTYHPRAPELDHIVPVSKGGEHSYRNTACSCRACNGVKSNRIIGRPSLLSA